MEHARNLDTLNSTVIRYLAFSTPYTAFLHDRESTLMTELYNAFTFNEDTQTDVMQCYSIIPAPTANSWLSGYNDDIELQPLIKALRTNSDSASWSQRTIKTMPSIFREHLLANRITFRNDRLLVFKPIPMTSRAVSLIIVPTNLRRIVFEHYHGSPSGGHMGEYKTLYRLRLRFLWPGMRRDIKSWVRSCAQCVAANNWRSRRSELYFSWPVTVPFWIMHIDLWSPGTVTDQDGFCYLLNCMCDLTQFVISIPVADTTAVNLAELFVEQVILTYGMCAVIVVDDGSNFKGVFESMCKILDITLWTLARGNHKGNSVERFHRFLNKTQTIAGASVGTHCIFRRNAKLSAYAWNSAPIDDTDIVRSIPAIGREFRFPLDTKLCDKPTINIGNSGLYEYLREVSTDSQFATGVLQILIEE